MVVRVHYLNTPDVDKGRWRLAQAVTTRPCLKICKAKENQEAQAELIFTLTRDALEPAAIWVPDQHPLGSLHTGWGHMFPRYVISVSGPDTTAFHMGQVKGDFFPGERQQESSQLLTGWVLEAHAKQARNHTAGWEREFMHDGPLGTYWVISPPFLPFLTTPCPCLPQAWPMFSVTY